MPKEKRIKKKMKRKKYRAFFICFVLIYLLFRSIPALYATIVKTTLIEEGIMEESIDLKGVIIRNEKLYRSDGEGKVKLFREEGDRVKVGTKVAEVKLTNDDSTILSELNEINEKIDSIEKINNDNKSNSDSEKSVQSTEALIEKIQDNILSKNYAEVIYLKQELNSSIGKHSDVSGEGTLANQSLEILLKEKEKLTERLEGNTINYFSQEAGIISFKIDGLEDILIGENIKNYSYKDIEKAVEKIRKVENDNVVSVGEPLFKVMDNYTWYLMGTTNEAKDLKNIKEGDNITLLINDDKNKLRGKVIKIDSKKDQLFLIVKFNTFFHEFYDLRNVNAKLIKSSNEGLKVPVKAISEKNGTIGVYIKDDSGIIKFRPIKILSQNDDFAIVSKGDENSYIEVDGNDRKVKTISLFDEILLGGGKMREGRIIDWQRRCME